jgi:hypothetical protein
MHYRQFALPEVLQMYFNVSVIVITDVSLTVSNN